MAGKIGLATVGTLVVLVLIIIGLIVVPEGLRVALRDIAIIFMVVLGIVSTLLMVLLVAALIVVVFLLKEKIVPLLEQLTQTAGRVRSTTEFVTDEVVQPIIQAAGTLARMRAMTRSALGRDRDDRS